jgi:hypothetical protein
VKEIAAVLGRMYVAAEGRADSTMTDALSRARAIPDVENRAAALSYVANALIRSGREEQGKQIGLEAVASIDAAPPKWTMMTTLCRLAPVMASCGELSRVCAGALRVGDNEAGIAQEIYAKLSADRAPETKTSERETLEARIQSLTSKTHSLAARFMAARFSGINVHSQEPEDGHIRIPGELSDDDIRANAINWIAQSMSAERELSNAKVIREQVQSALASIAADPAGIKEVVLGHVALILARAGEAGESKAVVDAIFTELAKRSIGPNVYHELLLAVCPALCIAGDLHSAVSRVKPLEEAEAGKEKDVDDIWKRAAWHLTRAQKGLDAVALIQARVESPDEKAAAFIDLVENLSGDTEKDVSPMLLAIGGIDECFAKDLPAAPRSRVIASVASRIADMGDEDMAGYLASKVIQQAESFEDSEAKGRVQAWIAQRLAVLGDEHRSIEAAEQAAATVCKEPEAIIATLDAARALAACGRFDRAQAVVESISDEWTNKDMGLSDIALNLATMGHVSDALALVERIELPAVKANSLADISENLVRNNDKEQALDLLHKAADLVNTAGNCKTHRTRTQLIPGERTPRSSSAWKIARAYVAAGEQDTARAFATELADSVDAAVDVTQASKAALCLLVAGLPDRANPMAEKVLSTLRTAGTDVTESAVAFAHLGRLFVLSGRPDEAVHLAKALWPSQPITDDASDSIRVHAALNTALDIVEALWEHGQVQSAKTLLDDLRANIAPIPNKLLSLHARGSVSIAYLQAGFRSEAAAISNDLLSEARADNRQFFFDALRYGVQSLIELDNVTVLWDVYQSLQDVESWWNVLLTNSTG